MRKHLLGAVFALTAVGAATPAVAGELSVKIANGRATVIAKDVPVRQILAEWARVGDTKVVNGEKVTGGPVTIELVDVPEKEALDILLRSAAGYITAPRPANVAGASQFDRVLVLATSRPPAATAVTPTFGARPAVALPPQPPPDDDDGEPGDQGPMPPPVMGPNGQMQVFPGPAVNGPNGPVNGPMNMPVGPNGMPVGPNGVMQGPNVNPNQPTTAPRPGMLPVPQQQVPPNPYTPQGRGARPGGDDQ